MRLSVLDHHGENLAVRGEGSWREAGAAETRET